MKNELRIEKEEQLCHLEEQAAVCYTAETVTRISMNNKQPYTIEEIDSRLEQAEEDFEAGRYYSNESVFSELTQFVNSL